MEPLTRGITKKDMAVQSSPEKASSRRKSTERRSTSRESRDRYPPAMRSSGLNSPSKTGEFVKEITMKEAADRKSFWSTYFFGRTEVPWDDFINCFREYIKTYGGHTLSDETIMNIKLLVDPTYESTVFCTEFDIFYQKFWKDIHKLRKIIKYKVDPIAKLDSEKFRFKVNLQVLKIPSPNPSNFTPETVFELQHVKYEDCATWEPFRVGNGKFCQLILEEENVTYNDVVFKLFPCIGGFKICCLSKNTRTKFRVEKKGYLLTPGMIIEVGKGIMMRVLSTFPYARTDFTLFHPQNQFYRLQADNDRYAQNFAGQKFDNVAALRAKIVESEVFDLLFTKNIVPKIVLEGMSGAAKGKTYTLKVDYRKSEFKVGKLSKDNDIIFDDITVSNHHCSIGYDMTPDHFGWYIIEDEPTVFGTHVLLPNYDQYQKGAPSNPHQLVDGMVICVDNFAFKYVCDVLEKNPDAEDGYKLISPRDKPKK